jgi:hypothetical protein
VYSSDASFFGDGPSNFGLHCYEEFKRNGVKRILELGCGQGRDAIFFASNGIDVVDRPCHTLYDKAIVSLNLKSHNWFKYSIFISL